MDDIEDLTDHLNSIKIKKITCDLTFDDSKARNKGWEPKSVLEYLKQIDL